MGVIGLGSTVKIGGKGKQDLKLFSALPGVRVTAVCDVDRTILETEAGKLKAAGRPVEAYGDFRKLLDSREVDAVVITTPNHWHAVMTVMACQAGKDVYVQKPASHNLWEGRKMVEAAVRYRRVVACPHGSRGATGFAEALEFVRAGALGRVLLVQGVNYKPRTSIGKVAGPQPVPPAIDYDLWCGPAPMKPLRRQYLHYDWHWDWDYGDGDLGNMGIHYLDACRWAAGQRTLPERVIAVGGRFGYDDDGQTPNTLIGFFDYRPAPIVFEVRGLPQNRAFREQDWERNARLSMDQYMGMQIGAIVHCENGYLAGSQAFDPRGRLIKRFEPTNQDTASDFIRRVRERNLDPHGADVLEAHLSAALVHMLNISYRTGKRTLPGQIREAVRGDKPMLASYERFLDHMYANRIDLEKDPAILGAALTMNPAEERFTGAFGAEANRLLRGAYRKPFELPERI